MQNLWQELRYGLRSLARQPLFTILAVLTLALGIGANTAVFSVVDAVLLRPLPYPEPDRLIALRERTPTFPRGSVSLPNYLDWREGQRGFTDLALLRRNSFALSAPGTDTPPERVGGGEVSANFLDVLGLRPTLGRNFTVEEDTPHGPPAVLISDALWRRRFSANPAAVGRRLTVDGVAREIVGIMPATVRFPRAAEILVPLADVRAQPSVLERDNHPGFTALGRLKPGVSLALAEENLDTIARGLEAKYPKSNTGRRVKVETLLDYSVGNYRQSLFLLLGAVACVLLIACANVANLQLTRAMSRTKELAVRAALGASRWRLARQMLTEGTLLGLLGGAAAVLCTLWALDAIVALSPANVSRFRETRLDWNALGYTALLALGAGMLVGVWPAWRISNAETLAAALREGGGRAGTGGVAQGRARATLVIAQVALAVVLLAGAGLTLKSFWLAQNAPLNFRSDNILTFSISLPESRYESKEKRAQFYTTLLERLHNLPGVVAAATGVNVPFDDNEWDSYFHVTGTPPYQPGQGPSAEINYVSPDYFKVLGMPILRGRAFGPEDVLSQPRSVIIDDSFVKRFFPDVDPIGQHIDDNQTLDKEAPPLTVIGVVAHTRNDAVGDPVMEKMTQMHFALSQTAASDQVVLVRVAAGDPLALTASVRREVNTLDPDIPIADVSTMERNISASLAPRRLTMTLLGIFGALALTLASVGLYGVMALSVTQRTRELGIRLALGAARSHVFALVLRQGMLLVGVGLGLGLLGALGAGRALQTLLFGVGALDAAALATAMGGLAFVALLACCLPARRATRVDPIVALRDE